MVRPCGLLSTLAAQPQKNVGSAPRSNGSLSFHGCRVLDANLRLAPGAGDPLHITAGDGDPASNSVQLVAVPVSQSPHVACRTAVFLQAKPRVTSNGPPSFRMW